MDKPFFFGNYDIKNTNQIMSGLVALNFYLNNAPTDYGQNTINVSISYTYLGKEQLFELHRHVDDISRNFDVHCDNQKLTINYAYINDEFSGYRTDFVSFETNEDAKKLSDNSFKLIFHDVEPVYNKYNAIAYLTFNF